ncbi:MAG: ribbon-helix-helix protein, CopG family [Proteobacteria bacterium]|nr:ribbon-helix-helix protein, CopG family [Pseudomonadota bacterium]
MSKKSTRKLSADAIAEMADNGKNISKFFSNSGTMKSPIQRVNVDFTETMLEELDSIADELNISRQAVIKTYLRQALDQHYIAKSKVS